MRYVMFTYNDDVTVVECATDEDAACYFADEAYEPGVDYQPFYINEAIFDALLASAKYVNRGELAEDFPAVRYFSIDGTPREYVETVTFFN